MKAASSKHTLGDVVKFVLKYRKGKCFRDWSIIQIVVRLTECLKCGTFCFVEDNSGRLVGIVMASHDHLNNVLHIDQILTIKSGVIPQMLQYMHREFPNCSITAERNGRFITYNTQRLVKHLQHLTK